MNKKINKNIKLGVFVVAGIIIFIGAVYYIGSQRNLFGNTVQITAHFKNVGGLQLGNNVRYSGINIGTVESISIVSDTKIRVVMRVEKDASLFIKEDADVSIGSEGLMGSKVISISSGSVDANNIGVEAELSSIEPVEIDQILAELEKTAKHAQGIMINLEEITMQVRKGEGTIGRLLTDPELVNNFDNMINAYYRTGQNAELFTANLANVSNSLQNGKGTLGMLLTDSIMANQFRNTLDSLETTLGNTSQTTQNLMEFSNMLKNEKGTIGKLLTDTVMAQQVETSINNINRGTQDLEETVQKVNNSWLLNLFGGKDKDKKKDESLR